MANGYWRISPEILKEDNNYPGRFRIVEPVSFDRPDKWTTNIRTSKTILLDVGYYKGSDNNNDPVDVWVNIPVFIPIGENYNGLRADIAAFAGLNNPISLSGSYAHVYFSIEPQQDSNGLYYAQVNFKCLN